MRLTEKALGLFNVRRRDQKVVVGVVRESRREKGSGLGDNNGRLNSDDIIVQEVLPRICRELTHGECSEPPIRGDESSCHR
jgi:hypothetical protein